MAESSIFYSWGAPVVGRETKGLEVFQEALGFWAKQKSMGHIEDFKVGLAAQGNYATFGGYLIIEGTKKNIADLLENKDVRNLVTRAAHVVQNLMAVRCDTGAAVPTRVEEIVAARKQLGIAT